MSPSHPIQVWYEFASTYSYVALHKVAALDAALQYRPFLLGPIFAAQGWNTSPFNLYPAKGRYMWRDMERLCEEAGLPLKRPSAFPRNGLLAARIALAHQDEPWMPAFSRNVYRANFAQDLDIASPDVLSDLLRELALEPAAILGKAESANTKQALRVQTERAVELGIFGAPSFIVNGELFWGGDRLQQAVEWSKRRP